MLRHPRAWVNGHAILRLDGGVGGSRARRRLLTRQLPPQLDDLSFHLRVFAALPHALKVRFDLALQLETAAARADREGFLDDVATEL